MEKLRPGYFYILTHKPTGMFYIGSTIHRAARIAYHRNHLKWGRHRNRKLQDIFTCWEDFSIQVTELPSPELAKEMEQRFLDNFCGTPKCCNVASDVRGIFAERNYRAHLGKKRSEESILKMITTRTGKKLSEEARLNIAKGKWKPVMVKGVEYPSVKAAEEGTGLTYRTLIGRIRSASKNNVDYFYK